jgi:hypothetical protein
LEPTVLAQDGWQPSKLVEPEQDQDQEEDQAAQCLYGRMRQEVCYTRLYTASTYLTSCCFYLHAFIQPALACLYSQRLPRFSTHTAQLLLVVITTLATPYVMFMVVVMVAVWPPLTCGCGRFVPECAPVTTRIFSSTNAQKSQAANLREKGLEIASK